MWFTDLWQVICCSPEIFSLVKWIQRTAPGYLQNLIPFIFFTASMLKLVTVQQIDNLIYFWLSVSYRVNPPRSTDLFMCSFCFLSIYSISIEVLGKNLFSFCHTKWYVIANARIELHDQKHALCHYVIDVLTRKLIITTAKTKPTWPKASYVRLPRGPWRGVPNVACRILEMAM